MDTKLWTRKLARRLGAVRQRKIRNIEQRLLSGTYRVPADEVAVALLIAKTSSEEAH